MIREKLIRRLLPALLFGLVLGGSVAGAAEVENPTPAETLRVTEIQPAPVNREELQPGLAAFYYTEFFERDLRRLPKHKQSEYRSFPGEPVLQLDHQFGDGKVFGSGSNRGVGMRLTGYLFFPGPGLYEMQALSNDGVRLYIDAKLVLDDPEQHSDQLSHLAEVSIATPGWYPVIVEYFQRKGTAALKLMRRGPGEGELTALPASVYRHMP